MRLPSALTGAAFLVAATASAAVLFPEPLHIVRESTDPISGITSTVDEYCSGDRIATVSGAVTVIADYARGEVTEIDRGRGTFSITAFEDIARAAVSHGAQPVAKSRSEPRTRGIRQAADGRQLESYEFANADGDQQIVVTVGVDRKMHISAAAAEALIGAAFPNRRSFVHDAIMRASGPDVALPSEHTISYELGGEKLVFRSAITAIDRQLAPEEVLAIPPGSRRVESRLTSVPRATQELDRLPRPEPQ